MHSINFTHLNNQTFNSKLIKHANDNYYTTDIHQLQQLTNKDINKTLSDNARVP